jgi:hypothetical protein
MRVIDIVQNKKRFIIDVINEEINVRNVKKRVLIEQLITKGVSLNIFLYMY